MALCIHGTYRKNRDLDVRAWIENFHSPVSRSHDRGHRFWRQLKKIMIVLSYCGWAVIGIWDLGEFLSNPARFCVKRCIVVDAREVLHHSSFSCWQIHRHLTWNMTMASTKTIQGRNLTYIERILNLPPLLDKKSHFLFGPRQTGKTFLIQNTLKEVRGVWPSGHLDLSGS